MSFEGNSRQDPWLRERQAIEGVSDEACSRCDLGFLHLKHEEFKEAGDCFATVLAHSPENGRACYGMGLVLAATGDYAGAIPYLRLAVSERPDFLPAVRSLGVVLHESGDAEGAVRVFETVLQVNPKRPMIQYLMANALAKLERFDSAIDHYHAALRIMPAFAEAHYRLGNAYFEKSDFVQAVQCYQAARRHAPGLYGAYAGEAHILMFEGRQEEAYSLIRPFIDRDDCPASLISLYSELCHQHGDCEAAANALRALLRRPLLPPGEEAQARFALGRLLDRQGDHVEAFGHIARANALKEERAVHAAELRRIRAILEVYNRDFVAGMPRSSVTSEQPVFIVGMPRSGTSLVEQILSAHSRIAGGGELIHINAYVASLGERTGSRMPHPYSVRGISPDLLASLAEDYLNHIGSVAGDCLRFTDKMPHNFLNLGFIEQLFPGARVIHCVRDPRDTCLSCYFQDFGPAHAYSYSLEFLEEYYRLYLALMAHWKRVLSLPVHTVQYEELVHDQDGVSRGLVEFCGLDWEDACLDFHRNTRQVATASHDQVRRKLYDNAIGRWMHYRQFLGDRFDSLMDVPA